MRLSVVLIMALIFLPSLDAIAHGGRLASDGCHNDQSSGMRHCHVQAKILENKITAKKNEADYVQAHCTGVVEHRLPDKTRVDCLTKDRAIEYDFARKWAEAIGQSLHYAQMTGKKAGIVLIKRKGGEKYVERTRGIIAKFNLPIDLEVISARIDTLEGLLTEVF